jgi:hypothetical protein
MNNNQSLNTVDVVAATWNGFDLFGNKGNSRTHVTRHDPGVEADVARIYRLLLCPSGLNLHTDAEFHFCNFFYSPNAFRILRDTIR